MQQQDLRMHHQPDHRMQQQDLRMQRQPDHRMQRRIQHQPDHQIQQAPGHHRIILQRRPDHQIQQGHLQTQQQPDLRIRQEVVQAARIIHHIQHLAVHLPVPIRHHLAVAADLLPVQAQEVPVEEEDK